MAFNFKYVPVLRSRQQELLVLGSFDFGDRIFPMLEIIKEKDRVNNSKSPSEIWLGYADAVKAGKLFIDLPVYIKDTSSMQDEVLSFNRTMLSNINRRIEFFKIFAPRKDRVVPVISSLLNKTGQPNSITEQIAALRGTFDSIAIRTFTNSFDADFPEIRNNLTGEDILIYDLDSAQPLNPLVKKQINILTSINNVYKISIKSAINTEVQNVKLDHGDVIADADNSLIDVFKDFLKMDGFGDYAGIKKDDLNSGGTISPGFIFYEPIDNLYYGYKGEIKNLSEFADTIVPAVLNSEIVKRILKEHPEFLSETNPGYQTLLTIQAGKDNGKSQAKFKRISIEHYLHCIKTRIAAGDFD